MPSLNRKKRCMYRVKIETASLNDLPTRFVSYSMGRQHKFPSHQTRKCRSRTFEKKRWLHSSTLETIRNLQWSDAEPNTNLPSDNRAKISSRAQTKGFQEEYFWPPLDFSLERSLACFISLSGFSFVFYTCGQAVRK